MRYFASYPFEGNSSRPKLDFGVRNLLFPYICCFSCRNNEIYFISTINAQPATDFILSYHNISVYHFNETALSGNVTHNITLIKFEDPPH